MRGLDAHLNDPRWDNCLTDGDFVQMTRVLQDGANEACRARIVSSMEGGHNIERLGDTVRAHLNELKKTES